MLVIGDNVGSCQVVFGGVSEAHDMSGKASGRRVALDRGEAVERLCRTRDHGLTARHFHAHLVRQPRIGAGAASADCAGQDHQRHLPRYLTSVTLVVPILIGRSWTPESDAQELEKLALLEI